MRAACQMAATATTMAEMDQAAALFAEMLVMVGAEVVMALVAFGAPKLISAGRKAAGAVSDAVSAGVRRVKKAKRADEAESVRPALVADDIDKALDEIYAKAPAAKSEIDAMADEIAAKYGGRVAKAPLKGRVRARQKVEMNYNGDTSKLNDIARNTIVVDKANIQNVRKDIEAKGGKVFEFKAEENPYGYTGINATVETKSGLRAEIQINSPEMIYAKEVPTDARRILGDETYDAISESSGMQGGLGHKFYEKGRVLKKNDPALKEIYKQSSNYYSLLRGN